MGRQNEIAKKAKKCQTSEPSDVEQLDNGAPNDDLIFEEIVVHDPDEDNRLLPQFHDDSNPVAQLGARNVISELKNILPKTVNPDSRRTRKEALFPEYWREKIPQPSDIIIPSPELMPASKAGQTSEANRTDSGQMNKNVTTFQDDSDTDDSSHPDFRSQLEKDLDDGRHDHLSPINDLSFPGNSSLASLLAKQVAKKSSKTEAEEFSVGD